MERTYRKKRKILSALFGVVLIENLNSDIFSKNITENLIKNQEIIQDESYDENNLSDSAIKQSIDTKNKKSGIRLYDTVVNIVLETASVGVITQNLNNTLNKISKKNNLDSLQMFGKLRLLYEKCCIKADNELEKSVLKECYNYTKLAYENDRNEVKLDKFTDDNYKGQLETTLINKIVDLWSTYDPEIKELSEHEIYEEFIKKRDISNTNSWIERFNGFKEFLCTDIPLGCCGSIRSFLKNSQYILYNLNNN